MGTPEAPGRGVGTDDRSDVFCHAGESLELKTPLRCEEGVCGGHVVFGACTFTLSESVSEATRWLVAQNMFISAAFMCLALTMPRRRGAAPGLGRSRSTGKASHDGRMNAPRDTRASAPISVPRPPRRAGRFTLLVFFFREMPPKPFPGSRSQPAVCTSTSVTAAETEPYSRARTAGRESVASARRQAPGRGAYGGGASGPERRSRQLGRSKRLSGDQETSESGLEGWVGVFKGRVWDKGKAFWGQGTMRVQDIGERDGD